MAIEKRIGDPVEVDMALEHKGAAITVRATLILMPGFPGSNNASPGGREKKIAEKDFNIAEHANWVVTGLPDIRGTYPEMNYQGGYLFADAYIDVWEVSGGNLVGTAPLLYKYYEDVYTLKVPVPVAEFRNLAGVFT